jgi:hypothetical protein
MSPEIPVSTNAFARLRAFFWTIAPWQTHNLHTMILCPDNEQLQYLRKVAQKLVDSRPAGSVSFQQARGFLIHGDKEPKTLRDGQFAVINKQHVRVLWLFHVVRHNYTFMDTI